MSKSNDKRLAIMKGGKPKRFVLGEYDLQTPIPVDKWPFALSKSGRSEFMAMKLMLPIQLNGKKIRLIAEII